jgi:hypothetical protein
MPQLYFIGRSVDRTRDAIMVGGVAHTLAFAAIRQRHAAV